MLHQINDPEFIAMVEKGVPLERLLRRLWPALDDDGEWNEWTRKFTREDYDKDSLSGYGFLGKSENLLECIHSDWQVVERYGTTHAAISEALEKVIAAKYPIRVKPSEHGQWEYKTVLPNHQLSPNYEFADWVTQGKLVNNAIPLRFMGEDNNVGGWQGCPWGCGIFDGERGIIIRRDLPQDEKVMAYLDDIDGRLDNAIDVINIFAGNEREECEQFKQLAKRVSSMKEAYLSRKGEQFYARITGLLPHIVKEHYFFEGKTMPYRADPEFLIHALDLVKR
ncbi:MAG: hypothetical protein AABX34_03730 [Nanoarchaeota archaeon]